MQQWAHTLPELQHKWTVLLYQHPLCRLDKYVVGMSAGHRQPQYYLASHLAYAGTADPHWRDPWNWPGL